MKKFRMYFSAALSAALLLLAGAGCSDDDNGTNNNPSGSSRINLELKAMSQFTYDRADLDSTNAEVAGSTRDYVVDIRGTGGLILGAYRDWFYRIGTDQKSSMKDTMYIRANTGSAGGNSFTKEVQAYGFIESVMKKFVEALVSRFPIAPPTIAGPKWDIIAKFHDDNGGALAVGTEWFITSENGEELNFNFSGYPIKVTLLMKGKFAAKEEVITVGAKQIKAWKTTITITATLPIGAPAIINVSSWFSDDPDGQIQVVQESGIVNIPIAGSIILPGETQKLKSYRE